MLDTDFLNKATRGKYIPFMRDQIYDNMPLFNQLNKKGRVIVAESPQHFGNVVAQRHSATGQFHMYDPITLQETNPLISWSHGWANYYGSVSISKQEELQNSGALNKELLVNMVSEKMKNCKNTMMENIAIGIYSDGTPIGNLTPIIGLKAAINTGNTYLNINRSAPGNDFWNSNIDSTAYTVADLKDVTSPNHLPNLMRKMQLQAAHNNLQPDLIITSKAIFNLYQDIAQANHLRYDSTKANLGFYGVEFGAGTVMIYDDYITNGQAQIGTGNPHYMYFLTMETWTLPVFAGANFDMRSEGWIASASPMAKSAQIIWMGQLRTDSPRLQAGLTRLAETLS